MEPKNVPIESLIMEVEHAIFPSKILRNKLLMKITHTLNTLKYNCLGPFQIGDLNWEERPSYLPRSHLYLGGGRDGHLQLKSVYNSIQYDFSRLGLTNLGSRGFSIKAVEGGEDMS